MEFPHKYWPSILILGTLLWGAGTLLGAAEEQAVDRIMAVVENEVITWSDLVWFIAVRDLPVPEEEKEKEEFYATILDQVINQHLIRQEVAKTPFIQVTEDELERSVRSYRRRYPSQEAFETFLEQNDMTMIQFRSFIRARVGVNKFVDLRFEPFIVILPGEIQAYYEEEYVPQLKENDQPVPDLSLVEDMIRELLTVRRTREQLESWVDSARERSQVQILYERENPTAPNLPSELLQERPDFRSPFSKTPFGNPQ